MASRVGARVGHRLSFFAPFRLLCEVVIYDTQQKRIDLKCGER